MDGCIYKESSGKLGSKVMHAGFRRVYRKDQEPLPEELKQNFSAANLKRNSQSVSPCLSGSCCTCRTHDFPRWLHPLASLPSASGTVYHPLALTLFFWGHFSFQLNFFKKKSHVFLPLYLC